MPGASCLIHANLGPQSVHRYVLPFEAAMLGRYSIGGWPNADTAWSNFLRRVLVDRQSNHEICGFTQHRREWVIRKQFWSGDIQTRHFGQRLYRNIPNDDGLKLKSFRYADSVSISIAVCSSESVCVDHWA